MTEEQFVRIEAHENQLHDIRLQRWEAEARQRFAGWLRLAATTAADAEADAEKRYHLRSVASHFAVDEGVAAQQVLALTHNHEFYAGRLADLLEKKP